MLVYCCVHIFIQSLDHLLAIVTKFLKHSLLSSVLCRHFFYPSMNFHMIFIFPVQSSQASQVFSHSCQLMFDCLWVGNERLGSTLVHRGAINSLIEMLSVSSLVLREETLGKKISRQWKSRERKLAAVCRSILLSFPHKQVRPRGVYPSRAIRGLS